MAEQVDVQGCVRALARGQRLREVQLPLRFPLGMAPLRSGCSGCCCCC